MEFVIIPNADSGWDEEEGGYDQSHFIYSQKITVNTATDMYYDLKDYFVNEDGESTVNWDELDWSNGVTLAIHYYFDWDADVEEYPTSILSITNIKTTGVNVSCKVMPKMIYAMLDELNGVNDTLKINSAKVDAASSKVKFTVNTSKDITKLNLIENGKSMKIKSINSTVEKDGTITWNVTVNVPANKKEHTVNIYALDTDGNKSESKQVKFNVKKGGK